MGHQKILGPRKSQRGRIGKSCQILLRFDGSESGGPNQLGMHSIGDSRRKISIKSMDENLSLFSVRRTTPAVLPVPPLRLHSSRQPGVSFLPPRLSLSDDSRVFPIELPQNKSRSRDHRQTCLPPSLVEPVNYRFPPSLVPWVRSGLQNKN